MPTPTKYQQGFDFSSAPQGADLGTALDGEFEAIQQSSKELVAAIGDIRRSDGHLKNRIVGQSTLASGLVDDLVSPTAATAAAEAQAASAAAQAAVPDAVAAIEQAATANARIAALAEDIRQNGWHDYGSIAEPPGPPVGGDDYGTIG